MNVRQGGKDIEVNGVLHILKKWTKKTKQKKKQSEEEKNISSNPCNVCGEVHFHNDCPYKKQRMFS